VSGEGAADGERAEDRVASEGKKHKKKKGGCGGGEGQDGDGGPAQILKSALIWAFIQQSARLLIFENFGQCKEPFRLQEASFDRIVLDPPCTAYGKRNECIMYIIYIYI
jgi:hypothetical protein